jgi:hypothetical protein
MTKRHLIILIAFISGCDLIGLGDKEGVAHLGGPGSPIHFEVPDTRTMEVHRARR